MDQLFLNLPNYISDDQIFEELQQIVSWILKDNLHRILGATLRVTQ